jgi:hypothetical protein
MNLIPFSQPLSHKIEQKDKIVPGTDINDSIYL